MALAGGGIETVDEENPGSKFLDDNLPSVQHERSRNQYAPAEAADRSVGDGDTVTSTGVVQGILRNSSHKTTATFHVGLKVAAIASYLLLGIFTSSFVVQFVVTVTLLAVDFWAVKNVSGRLLVGLRWWNEIDEDGTTQSWRFESVADRAQLNTTDSRIFWWTLYIAPLLWILLGVVSLLKFHVSYLIIVAIAVILSGANIVGYYKCDKDATEQMRNYIGRTMLGHAMESSGLGGLRRFMQ